MARRVLLQHLAGRDTLARLMRIQDLLTLRRRHVRTNALLWITHNGGGIYKLVHHPTIRCRGAMSHHHPEVTALVTFRGLTMVINVYYIMEYSWYLFD
ncbi:uncharacterized protein M6B38_315020 [Iris pallida]|uniref:Uncharacterized protein n=1 Tax=Iris pallida TaxID=29817 RepID=A0AAX6HFL4_IRIPA|nr:uncharacterized protein M6B38_315020 [Iris pallida]